MKGKKILVTGGAGFVGSHACKALAGAGYLPVVLDNLSRGHRRAVMWGPLVEADIHDQKTVEEVIRAHKPVGVMHFAAYAYVGESMENPGLYYDNNVSGTLSLLNAMKAAGCRTLVFSSSCAVYGGVHSAPIDESTPRTPSSTYGFSKMVCEQMIADYCRAHDFSATALRYFNAAGSDPDGELGENHEPEPHIIPTVLRVAAGREPEVRINGTDHATVDGTCVRDFVHVSDLASAHSLAFDYSLNRRKGFSAFNLGIGRGYSLNEVVEAARRVTGKRIPVRYVDRRPGDPPYAVGRADLAREVLGWQPRYTSLDTMLCHAWSWIGRSTESGDRQRGWGVQAQYQTRTTVTDPL